MIIMFELIPGLNHIISDKDLKCILEAFVESDYVKGDCTYCELDVDGFVEAYKSEVTKEMQDIMLLRENAKNNCQHLYKTSYKLNDNKFINKVGCELYGREVLIDSDEETAIKKLCNFC